MKIIRSTTGYATSPAGDVVYEGTGNSFTDTGLDNGKTYYYSIFAYDHKPNYSSPVTLSVSPRSGITQVDLSQLQRSASRAPGILIKYPNNSTVYLLEDNQQKPIPSYAIYLQRFRNLPIATIPETQTYPDGAVLSFPPGSLIKSPSDPTVYLILDNSDRYGFTSAEEFFRFGFRFDLVDETTEEELSSHPTSPIQNLSYHATGNLIKYPSSATVYRIENNTKRGFSSPEAFFFYGDFRRILTIDPSFQYPDGTNMSYPEGALVRTAEDPTVYLITNGKKHAYSSAEQFLSDGYDFSMIRPAGDGELLTY